MNHVTPALRITLIIVATAFVAAFVLPSLLSAASTPLNILGVCLVVFPLAYAFSYATKVVKGQKVYATCHYCRDTDEAMVKVTKDQTPQPNDWYAFQRGMASPIHVCGRADCRVSLANRVANDLTV